MGAHAHTMANIVVQGHQCANAYDRGSSALWVRDSPGRSSRFMSNFVSGLVVIALASFSGSWLAGPSPAPLSVPPPAEVERLPQLAVSCPPCTPCPAPAVGASWPTWALVSLVLLGFGLGVASCVCCLGGLAAAAEVVRRCNSRRHSVAPLQLQVPRGRESLPLRW